MIFRLREVIFALRRVILPVGSVILLCKVVELSIIIYMSESILREKAKEFAKEIVFTTRGIRNATKESVLTNQLLRSGTSIGANIHEAQYAQGRADFISKLEISLKECFESEYWLDLLFETGYLEEEKYNTLRNECGVLRKMLISSCKTAKENG